MDGKVKWFSEEKGYGYIVGEDDKDYYFNIREVKGADLPRNGDVVSFTPGQGNKGPRASAVTTISKAPPKNQTNTTPRHDDRVTCPSCLKKMVPRMITYNGSPSKSVCPFCGETYKEFNKCFIATAVYGDNNAPEVIALRHFRDETLATTAFGKAFIAAYYRLSPPIAVFLKHHELLSNIVRKMLNVLVGMNRR